MEDGESKKLVSDRGDRLSFFLLNMQLSFQIHVSVSAQSSKIDWRSFKGEKQNAANCWVHFSFSISFQFGDRARIFKRLWSPGIDSKE
jgi:hypothetical protein